MSDELCFALPVGVIENLVTGLLSREVLWVADVGVRIS